MAVVAKPKFRVHAKEKTVPAQHVVELTCRIVSAFETRIVPDEFKDLHASLGFTAVEETDYVREIVALADRIPKRVAASSSPDIEKLRGMFGDTAERVFLVAYLVNECDVYKRWQPKSYETKYKHYCSLNHGIRLDRDKAARTMRSILAGLVRAELDDRVDVVCSIMDAPFFLDNRVNEFVVLGLAHYEPAWIRDFKTSVAPFVHSMRTLDRVQDIVHADVDTYMWTLGRVPPRFPHSKRFEIDVWGEETPHPEAGRIMYAFFSVWFQQALRVFRWDLDPPVIRKLNALADRGWCPTMHEVTSPFGSRS